LTFGQVVFTDRDVIMMFLYEQGFPRHGWIVSPPIPMVRSSGFPAPTQLAPRSLALNGPWVIEPWAVDTGVIDPWVVDPWAFHASVKCHVAEEPARLVTDLPRSYTTLTSIRGSGACSPRCALCLPGV
jgi:hypothetical protein